jgi:hypothetical protein
MQELVIVVTILGALVSLWGILRAFAATRARAAAVERRLVDNDRLTAEQEAERAELGPMSDEETAAFAAKWDEAFAERGIVRATWNNIAALPFLQAKMDRVGRGAGLDLALSVGGLVVATGAGILSLFIPV